MRQPTSPKALSVLALTGVFLALTSGPAMAQSSAPAPDAKTVKVVKTALERAARVWSAASVVQGGGAGEATAETALNVGPAVLTGEAAVAGLALAQAATLIVATGAAVDVYMSRSGSIAKYGNPYGMSSEDIAFPLLRQLRARRAQPSVPAPFPVPEPVPAPKSDEERPDERRPGRVYATYTRYNRKTGRYYSGRTSAVIDLNKPWKAQAAAAVRARNGRRNPDENAEPKGSGFLDAMLDRYAVGFAVDYADRYRDAGYLAVRGREQQLIDYLGARRAKERGIETFRGGAQSDTAPDESLTENAIRGVARDNLLGELFHNTANLAFGQLAPYTGDTRFQ